MSRRTGVILAVAIGMVLFVMAATAWFALHGSEHILDSYSRINNGLDSVRSTLDERTAASRAMLSSFMCKEMMDKSDSLHLAFEALAADIDSYRTALEGYPLDDADIADSLFADGDRGAALHNGLLSYFALAERICTSDSIDLRIAENARQEREPRDLAEWRALNFHDVPAIACRTILGKLRADALNTEALVLNDLLARCKPAKGR